MKSLKNKIEKDLSDKICYVCLKQIKELKIYIGKNMFRHPKCIPGSSKWLKSKISKKTEHFYKKI